LEVDNNAIITNNLKQSNNNEQLNKRVGEIER